MKADQIRANRRGVLIRGLRPCTSRSCGFLRKFTRGVRVYAIARVCDCARASERASERTYIESPMIFADTRIVSFLLRVFFFCFYFFFLFSFRDGKQARQRLVDSAAFRAIAEHPVIRKRVCIDTNCIGFKQTH